MLNLPQLLHRAAILLLATCNAAAAAEPKYLVEASETRRVEATLKYEVHCPQMAATHWVLFAPAAGELPSQRKAKSTAAPVAKRMFDARVRNRELLVIAVAENNEALKHRVSMTLRYEATLVKRTLRARTAEDRSGAPPTLKREERAINLAPNRQTNFDDAAFKAFLDKEKLGRQQGETEIAFARRVYQYGQSHGTYEYREDIPRRATDVAESWRTDCGGWANWFVAVLRAGGVPARALVGRWAKSQDKNIQPSNQGHVKAEFFAEGVGWIPVDLSQAVQHERSKDSLRYFGVDEGDFITLHVDTDVELQMRDIGKQQWRALQSPAYWVMGKGSVDGATTTEDWQVRDLGGKAK
jgi:hypothetical protein